MTPLLLMLLFCLSMLPPAYLRYYPFRHIASRPTKIKLAAGSLLLCAGEMVLLGGCLLSGWLQIVPGTLQKLYNISYLPYELLLMGLVRHYFFRHLFVLGIQGMYMYLLHCLCATLMLQFVGLVDTLPRMGMYMCLYLLALAGSFMPALKFLDWAVPEQVLQQPARIWRYLGPIPVLLVYYQSNLVHIGLMPLSTGFIVPRLFMGIFGGLLSLMLQRGILHLQQNVRLEQKNIRLSRQLQDMQKAVDLLQEEQQKQAILRHDTRHQLQIVAELAAQEKWTDAEKFVREVENA